MSSSRGLITKLRNQRSPQNDISLSRIEEVATVVQKKFSVILENEVSFEKYFIMNKKCFGSLISL